MSTPIIEHIAENIKTDINAITTGNGYNQTLVALRPKRLMHLEAARNDLSVIISQENPEIIETPSNNLIDWKQPFSIDVIIVDSDDATDSIDTRINQARSDIEKKLNADTTRGGYAMRQEFEPPEYFIAEGISGITLKLNVYYRTKYDDPYSQ